MHQIEELSQELLRILLVRSIEVGHIQVHFSLQLLYIRHLAHSVLALEHEFFDQGCKLVLDAFLKLPLNVWGKYCFLKLFAVEQTLENRIHVACASDILEPRVSLLGHLDVFPHLEGSLNGHEVIVDTVRLLVIDPI